MEGENLVEPAEVSKEKEDEVYFLDQEYSGLHDDKVWECIECIRSAKQDDIYGVSNIVLP